MPFSNNFLSRTRVNKRISLDFQLLTTLRRHKDVDTMRQRIGSDFRFVHIATHAHALQIIHLVDRVRRVHTHIIHAVIFGDKEEFPPLLRALVRIDRFLWNKQLACYFINFVKCFITAGRRLNGHRDQIYQPCAFVEGAIADGLNGIGDGHRRKFCASVKGVLAYRNDGVADSHVFQFGAVVECGFADGRDGIADSHGSQPIAADEGTFSDGSDGVADGHGS